MAIFSSLTRNQKEAIGLLQIGTFLEYFDLFLYIRFAHTKHELTAQQNERKHKKRKHLIVHGRIHFSTTIFFTQKNTPCPRCDFHKVIGKD